MQFAFSRAVIAIILAVSIGLHWTLLQSVAWAGMFVKYSKRLPVVQALEQTFDGKHPCALCNQIAKAKQTEKRQDVQIEVQKLNLFCSQESFVFVSPSEFYLVHVFDERAIGLSDLPLVPPPRLV